MELHTNYKDGSAILTRAHGAALWISEGALEHFCVASSALLYLFVVATRRSRTAARHPIHDRTGHGFLGTSERLLLRNHSHLLLQSAFVQRELNRIRCRLRAQVVHAGLEPLKTLRPIIFRAVSSFDIRSSNRSSTLACGYK